MGTAGLDALAVHQVEQHPEHYQLCLFHAEVEVCEGDVGEPGEGRLRGVGYAPAAGASFGFSS